MTYVFLVPDPSLSRITQGSRALYEHNQLYAQQVAHTQSDAGFVTISAATEAEIWPRTLSAYRQAARNAGVGGTLGLLVGHGIAQGTVRADLAPPLVLRATEQDVALLAQRRSNSAAKLSVRQQRVIAIGRAIGAHVRRVDLYTCNVGGGVASAFLDDLHEVWRIAVRGLTGSLVSRRAGSGPVGMYLTREGRRVRGAGYWYDEIPPVSWWRRSTLPERQIELPRSMLTPRKASRAFGDHGSAPARGRALGTYREHIPLGRRRTTLRP